MYKAVPLDSTKAEHGLDHKSFLFLAGALLGVPLAVWFRFSVTVDPATGGLRYQPLGPVETLAKSALLVGTLCLIGFFFWLVERTWPEDAEQTVAADDRRLNALYLVLNQCVMVRVAATVLVAVASGFTLMHLPRIPSSWIEMQPIWLQTLEIALLKDFLGYWNHRMFHTVPALWRFHAVHHSSEQVHWFSATREHPFEQIVGKMVTVLPLYLLGFPLTVLGPFVGFWLIYLMFLHANVNCSFGPIVRYLVVSPAFHRWHHTNEEQALDRNYATLLPIWDFLFRTAYFPKNAHPKSYGLYKETMPTGFWAQFLYPFRRAARPADVDLPAKTVPTAPPVPEPNKEPITAPDRTHQPV
ncbi:MAG: sterol desaturase family protein [Capsulimonadales bacterium]|nr:sterol desaturase family protein [Capsulimonadales bacterium]